MAEKTGKSLTRREFDAVIRRAAELASSDPEAGDGALTEAELFRIAGEVGLDAHHVRRALSELKSGATAGGPFTLARVFGPASVRGSRIVSGTPRHLAAKLDEFLVASQLLQPVRRGPSVLQYRPAVDWASQLARAASFSSRKYYIASAKSVEILLADVGDERTMVEVVVDPGTRNDNIAGAVLGGGAAGVGIGIGVAASLASAGLLMVAAATLGVGVGAGLTTGITYWIGQAHKRKLGEVQAEIEGVLDALEIGASLEPPPASWRRWVKRHFHGVARDLLSTEEQDVAELGDLEERP